MEPINAFTFLKDVYGYNPAGAFVARLKDQITTKKELFEALYSLLDFPSYFGFNWDALFDCLSNFEWRSEELIVLIHEEVPHLPETELRIYLDVLCDAVNRFGRWHQDNDAWSHQIEVVFKESDRERVLHSLSQVKFIA